MHNAAAIFGFRNVAFLLVETYYECLIQGLLEKGFGYIDNPLPKTLQLELRKVGYERYNKGGFLPASVGNQGNKQVATHIRQDAIYWLDNDGHEPREKEYLDWVQGYVDYLNATCYAGIYEMEFHYARYGPGAFYKKHVDRFANDNRRLYSMVYYLTEEWGPEHGGQLVLYLANETVEVAPMPGRLVCFESHIPHEVLPTAKERLSITGWLKRRRG